MAYGGRNETGYMPGPYLVTLPESEVIDLTSTTTDIEIFFDTEEYFTPGNDGYGRLSIPPVHNSLIGSYCQALI